MEGKGKVISTHDGKATVLIKKSSACGHDCGECRLCSNPEITVEILNPINAAPGDSVVIGVQTSQVLAWAFVLYILPLIGAMIIYASLSLFFTSSLIRVFAIALWIGVWFLYIRFYSKKRVVMSSALEVIHEKN